MNNNTFVHKYIKPLINKQDIAVDMTMGNGFDTLYLSELAKYVYSFDVLEEALISTKTKLKNENVKLILDSHINIDKYIKEKVKLFIFNLGYLPHSQNHTITKASDTLIAFKKAYELLIDQGYIVITFYLGHNGGKDEYYLLDRYFTNNHIKVLEKYRQDKIDSPITYIIKKSS